MVAGAVLRRELGSLTRRWTTCALPALLVLVAGSIVTRPWDWSWPAGDWRNRPDRLHEMGRELLLALFITEIAAVSFLAPLLTAGVIAGERERRTLELIFLTPLSALEILAAKFLSRMAYLLLLVLLLTPVLLACLSLGGMSPAEILINRVLVLASALWCGAVGLFFSATAERTYQAVLRSYAFLLAQTLGVPAVLFALDPRSDGAVAWFAAPQNYAIARIALERRSGFWGGEFWPAVAGLAVLGALLLLVAGVPFLRRRPVAPAAPEERDTPSGADGRPARRPLDLKLVWGLAGLLVAGMLAALPVTLPRSEGFALLPLAGAGCALALLVRADRPRRGRGGPIWDNPVAWKEVVFHGTTVRRCATALTLLAFSGLLYEVCALEPQAWRAHNFHDGLLAIEVAALLLLQVVQAAASAARDVEAGHLAILGVTPLSRVHILIGKCQGVWATSAPVVAFTGLHLAAALCAVRDAGLLRLLPALLLLVAILHAHTVLALWLVFRMRRLIPALGLHVFGAATLYVFLPAFLDVLRASTWLVDLAFWLNPLVLPFGLLSPSTSRFFAGNPSAAVGWACSLLFYGAIGLAIPARLVRRFDTFMTPTSA